MKKLLMIPDRYHLEADVELAKKYSLGYEYNDFFNPSVLDNKNEQAEIVKGYRDTYLPQHSTLHGAFFDVIPYSLDE